MPKNLADSGSDLDVALIAAAASTAGGVVVAVAVNLVSSAYQLRLGTWPWLIAVAVVVAAIAWPFFVIYFRRWRCGPESLRAVAATQGESRHLELFAVTDVGRVVWSTYRQMDTWSRWRYLPLSNIVDVAAVSPTARTIELFAVDRSGQMWCLTQTDGTWSSKSAVPDSMAHGRLTRLCAASIRAKHREVYACTEGGRVVHNWRIDGKSWEGWSDSGLRHWAVDVAASSGHDELLDNFAVQRDATRLWHRYFWNKWHEWSEMHPPGSAGIAVAAYRQADEHQEVFVVGSSGDIHHRWWTRGSNWTAWASMHPPDTEAKLRDAAAGITSAHHHQLLVVDEDGLLWHKEWSKDYGGDWSTWRCVETLSRKRRRRR